MQLLEVLVHNNSRSHNSSVEKVKPRFMKQVRKGYIVVYREIFFSPK